MCSPTLDSIMSDSYKNCKTQYAAFCPVYTTCLSRAKSDPCPQDMEHYSNTNINKIILRSAFFQVQSTSKMTYLRQFCCSGRQKWATKLLLRPNGCWKWWCRKYSCNTVDFVYPPLHFFWTPVGNRHIYVRVFLSASTPCPFLINDYRWHKESFILLGTINPWQNFIGDVTFSTAITMVMKGPGIYNHQGVSLWLSLKEAEGGKNQNQLKINIY